MDQADIISRAGEVADVVCLLDSKEDLRFEFIGVENCPSASELHEEEHEQSDLRDDESEVSEELHAREGEVRITISGESKGKRMRRLV